VFRKETQQIVDDEETTFEIPLKRTILEAALNQETRLFFPRWNLPMAWF